MSSSTSREQGLAEQITNALGDKVTVDYANTRRLRVSTSREHMIEVGKFMKSDLGFDHVASVSGVDYPEEQVIEVVYHLGGYEKTEMRELLLALACRLPRDDSKMPSLYGVWKSVEFHERETFEMLGVTFEGHPQLERLLLPEDWNDIPPLRKEFKNPGR